MNKEVLEILDALAHLRDLPMYKNIKATLDKRLAEIEASLGPKPEPAPPKAKAVPAAEPEIERRI